MQPPIVGTLLVCGCGAKALADVPLSDGQAEAAEGDDERDVGGTNHCEGLNNDDGNETNKLESRRRDGIALALSRRRLSPPTITNKQANGHGSLSTSTLFCLKLSTLRDKIMISCKFSDFSFLFVFPWR